MTNILCVGHVVQDFVFAVDTMPSAAQKYRAKDFQTVGGGPAATAAVAISRLGGSATLAARVGQDSIADLIVAELENYDVDCRYVKRLGNCMSSLSAVLVDDDGERLIVNYLDADLADDSSWLPPHLPDGIDAVLADTRWPDGALHAMCLARDAGVPAVLDGDLPVPVDGELVRTATHVAFSAAGLAEFSGVADTEQALQMVAAKTDAWCCVTLGEQGTMYLEGGEPCLVPAFVVEARDTLGAGDVWHGAFALGLAEGQALTAAMRFASAAAALKVAAGGGRDGAPTREDVTAFLETRDGESQP